MNKIIDVIRNLEKDINNQGLLIEFTEPMTMEQIREVEAKFDFTFPEDYTSFITTHGLIGFRNEKSERSMCDSSYRNKYTLHLPYNSAAFEVEEQKKADMAAMLATFQQASQFFKKYNDKESLLKAVKLYDEVLTWFTLGKVVDDHVLLNTHYLKSRGYVYLHAYCKQQHTAEELNELKRMIIEQSRYTLSLVPATTELPYYKEIVRACSNSVAWNMAELATGNAELEQALTILQQGIDFIEMPEQFFLYDTQVRILLKLGQKAEAYRIVRNVLTLLPEFADFQDIKQHADYKTWLENKS